MASESRILVHFSCGAASAVAWKVAAMRYGTEAEVEAIYCAGVENDEHPDNQRFLVDVERWVGAKVTKLYHPKYSSVDDVFLGTRFIASKSGASCTRILKREIGEAYSRPDDRHVFGYTADERHRIERFKLSNQNVNALWLLANAGITKTDCYRIISGAAGIELPAMYRLGYGHSNCIGCVKGGKGYWNKIRRDFPEVFARRAAVQREIGPGACFRSGGEGFMLDELNPEDGRNEPEPDIECGVFCTRYGELLEDAAAAPPRNERRDGKWHDGNGRVCGESCGCTIGECDNPERAAK
jgi:hypothetical protein